MKQVFKIEEAPGKICNAEDLFNKVQAVDIDHTRENMIVTTIDTRGYVIQNRIETIGILNANLVHPREIFRNAIIDCANAVILSHNHPAGELTPSEADIQVTRMMVRAGELIGIKVYDHVIFNRAGEFLSLREQHPDLWLGKNDYINLSTQTEGP